MEGAKPYSFSNKPRLNRANYRFQDQKDRFLFKEPGQIEGQVFDLNNIDECNIYLHDFHNQSFVDYVKNSVVVFGP